MSHSRQMQDFLRERQAADWVIQEYLDGPAFSLEVAGFAEATALGSVILLLADDECFIALNIRNGYVVDNGAATARGMSPLSHL